MKTVISIAYNGFFMCNLSSTPILKSIVRRTTTFSEA